MRKRERGRELGESESENLAVEADMSKLPGVPTCQKHEPTCQNARGHVKTEPVETLPWGVVFVLSRGGVFMSAQARAIRSPLI